MVEPDGVYHLTSRGNDGRAIFMATSDRVRFLALLELVVREQRWILHAYCLMDNHVHLILVPKGEDGLRAALGEAHRRYTRHVNFREGWRGHLFQARFASFPMDDAHLMAGVRDES